MDGKGGRLESEGQWIWLPGLCRLTVPFYPQAGVVAAEKTWLGMEQGLWPWTASFMLAALCVLRAGLSFGANISMPWIGGRIVRAAMW